MTSPQSTEKPPAQLTIQDHVTRQKQEILAHAQNMVNVSQNIIDSWANNLSIAERVKSKRNDQVNMLLGFINQLANDGIPQINEAGTEIQDPVISNKVLECNNILMTAARNVLTNIQQQEAQFQAELKALLQPQQKTEVKTKEA